MERRNQLSFDMSAMLQFAICLAALIGFGCYIMLAEEPVKQLLSLELGPLLIALAMASLIGLINSIYLMGRVAR